MSNSSRTAALSRQELSGRFDDSGPIIVTAPEGDFGMTPCL